MRQEDMPMLAATLATPNEPLQQACLLPRWVGMAEPVCWCGGGCGWGAGPPWLAWLRRC